MDDSQNFTPEAADSKVNKLCYCEYLINKGERLLPDIFNRRNVKNRLKMHSCTVSPA